MKSFNTLKGIFIQYPLLIIFLFSPLIIFPTFNAFITTLAWVVILAVWGIRFRVFGSISPRTPVDIIILCLLLLLPVSIWASVSVPESAVALHRILYGIVLFYGVVATIQSRDLLIKLVWFLLLGGSLLAAVGLFTTNWQEAKITVLAPAYSYIPQFLNLPGVLAGQSAEGSSLFHPNIMAVSIGMIIPLGWGLFFVQQRKWQKILVVGLLLWMAGVMLLTQSRLAIAALLVVLWFMATAKTPRLWWLVFACFILVVSAGFIIGPAIVVEQFMDIFFGTGTGSWAGRQDVWQNAIYALSDFSFTGVGLAMFEPVSRLLYPYAVAGPSWHFRHAHNIFLQMGLDLGLGGLIVFIALLFGLAWAGRRAYRTSTDPYRSLMSGILGSLGVYIGFGLFDALAFWVKPGFLPWLIFGLLIAGRQLSDDYSDQSLIEK